MDEDEGRGRRTRTKDEDERTRYEGRGRWTMDDGRGRGTKAMYSVRFSAPQHKALAGDLGNGGDGLARARLRSKLTSGFKSLEVWRIKSLINSVYCIVVS